MNELKKTITALATPFKNNEVDFESLERLICFQIQNGIEGFVVHGTTGESPTTTNKEKKEIFQFIKSKVPQDFPLIVGTGSYSTQKTIEDTNEAKNWGAVAVLVVVPYYNKPPQRGLVEHFNKIAETTQMPVILYNVPGRTITALSLESILELSKNKQIVGIKEASGQIELAKQIYDRCGDEFVLLSGDDGSYPDFLQAGGHGVISVASHIIPEAFSNWRKWAQNQKFEVIKDDFLRYKSLIDLLFCEANPIPLKEALRLMGVIQTGEMRLPLVPLLKKFSEELKAELGHCGVSIENKI